MDLVDDLESDEECHFLDQMSVFGENLDVVELLPITLAPPSTYQTRENQMLRKTNEICRVGKGREVKNYRERDTP